ncbi:MAG: phytoene desaturase family protein [Acidimicrobiia bacterium]
MPVNSFDVIVIGGGHNGLVAAGLLAKSGKQVVVLERREVVGGAAITELPFGPDFKVTALSYVVSLMPPAISRELRLADHGYKIYPQAGYFMPYEDGRHLQMADDPAERHRQISKFSVKDAEAMVRWDAWLGGLAAVLGPLLSAVPPRIGSKRPGDLFDLSKLGWHLRHLDVQTVGEITRLFTASIADLLEAEFESDAVRGVLSVSGVIGTWAGPRSPGTAYVMAHHKIGDIGPAGGDDGKLGAWGFPEGGMGGVTTALRSAAEQFGATVRTDAPVARITTHGGRVSGVVLASGEEFLAPVVITTTHPKISFLGLLDRSELPDDFVTWMERWQTRSGTVKVNLALDRLPTFTSHPEFHPDVHGGTIVMAQSLDRVEQAFQDAVAGRPAALPFADICVPSVFDPTLAPEGKHVMSMFTQWVPHEWAAEPHRDELHAYADRLIASVEAVAPGFTSSILHRQVIGPYEMEHTYGLIGGNIFHGELSAGQLFHMRPAPGFADFRTPIRGLYQAGSATHGGGGVTGIPGLNVVAAIREDARADRLKPWRRPH